MDSIRFMWHKYTLPFMFLTSLLISFLLYGNTISAGFVYDDYLYIERKDLRDWRQLPNLWRQSQVVNNLLSAGYRPLSVTSFALNFIVFGESPKSFHIANIIINAMVTTAVYLFTRQLFGNGLLPLITAILFAFFPIHTENVAYIKSRDDMLGALFMLGSIHCFLQTVSKTQLSVRWLLLSWCMYAAAVVSKELTAITPVICLLLAFQTGKIHMSIKASEIRKYLLLASGFVVVFILMFVARILVFGTHAFNTNDVNFIWNPLMGEGVVTRLWTMGKILYWYVVKTVVPIGLSATYAYNHFPVVSNPSNDMTSVVGWGFFLMLLGGMVWKRTRPNALGIGATLFLVPIFLLLKIFFQASDIFSERWMYFPSIGIALIGGYLLVRCMRRARWVGIGVLLLLLTWYAAVLIPRNRVWETRRTLAESIVRDAPDSVQGYYMLSVVNFNEGHVEEAKKLAKKSYDIYQEYPPVTYLLGRISYHENQYDDARRWFGTTITLSPTVSAPHKYYALMLTKLGRYQESLDHVRAQFLRNPTDKQLRLIVGIDYFELGDIDTAKQILPPEVFTGEATRKQGLPTFPLDSWREQLIDEARRD